MFPEHSTRTPFRTLLGSENPVFSVVRICRSNSWVSEHTSFALLKTRQHLLREQVEGMWKDLVRKGWKQVPAVWGPEQNPEFSLCVDSLISIAQRICLG